MVYPPEVQAKIDALESELRELKSQSIKNLPKIDLSHLASMTGLSEKSFYSHISWLARASVIGAVTRERYVKNTKGIKAPKKVLKMSQELTFDEIPLVAKCFEEIIKLLEKYASEIKLEAENGTD